MTEARHPETLAVVGLGANLGDALSTVRHAAARLRQLPQTRWMGGSALWRSAPVQAQGPDFINAVVVLGTRLEPLTLLDALQALELEHGRERPYPNAPRTLDLDLLFFGNDRIQHPRLTVPHPRLHERAFVCLPLEEIAPGLLARWGWASEAQPWAQQRCQRVGPMEVNKVNA